jgi:L,D-transpeptidase ErfK/SrfK
MQYDGIGRRAFLAGAVAVSTAALMAQAQEPGEVSGSVRRNMSSFRALDWHPYFADTRNGAILVDTTSRALHFWSGDQTIYKLYPTSVPLSEELTRRGRTEVVKKVVGPEWRPTPSMKERNPEWPDFIPPGPDNPLGTHALYLSWQYYRPRDPRHPQDLPPLFERLHRPLQPAHRRAVRVDERRHPGVAHLTTNSIIGTFVGL